ncbi:N-acetylneuraminate synthase family protein [Patescibacteria group bacterium]|nr:N-acetylneuraminate synthase family protein [Patescibacteria group bacterium]
MIVVELGQNFNGDTTLGKAMIKSAVDNGADAVKLQLYDADKIYGKGSPYYKYGKMGELSFAQFKELVNYADGIIDIFTSVFDVERVRWCEEVGIRMYKVAARKWHNKELAKAIRATGKPVIQSIDPYLIKHWDRAFPVPQMKIPESLPCYSNDTSYLYCCSKYPATIDELHFASVDFQDDWDGFSDHTIGMTAALTAMARGARIIEKHFTLDKVATGFDHLWSMTPPELLQLATYQKVLKEVYGDNRDWVRSNGDDW